MTAAVGKEVTITGSGFQQRHHRRGVCAVADAWSIRTRLLRWRAPSCSATVDSRPVRAWIPPTVAASDKFSVVFTVHDDEFDAGKVNYICAKDDESAGGNRYASAVKPFTLTDSLSVCPGLQQLLAMKLPLSPRDFDVSDYHGIPKERVARQCWKLLPTAMTRFTEQDGSDYVFDMPGGLVPSGTSRSFNHRSTMTEATATISRWTRPA